MSDIYYNNDGYFEKQTNFDPECSLENTQNPAVCKGKRNLNGMETKTV